MGMKTTEESKWRFEHDSVEIGPMSDDELRNAADTGLLLPTDKVWHADSTDPVPAAEIEGLFRDEAKEQPGSANIKEDFDESQDSESIYQPDVVGTGSVTCIHCWYKFNPEDVLFVARHPDLIGDPVLGSGDQQRFLPSRFTPEGHAIDSEGVVCPEVACPRCHLQIPRSLLTQAPLFISLVGDTGCGKSYFLACMSWQLRTLLPERFLISFADADGNANSWLTDYEERLFMHADDDALVIIKKTEARQQSLFREVTIGGMNMALPLPSVFTLRAHDSSLFHRDSGNTIDRSLVLYDAAGEIFRPGMDTASDPGTQHLAHAEALFLMFDPTRSPGFRKVLSGANDPQLAVMKIVQRQDVIFSESLNRIKLHLGLDGSQKYRKPVVVLLSKSDLFDGDIADILAEDPWRWRESLQSHSLDLSYLMRVSFMIRALIVKHAPEVTESVEAFADDVLYIPISALGCSPIDCSDNEGNPSLAVRPKDINPRWVEVPLLYTLFKLGHLGGMAFTHEEHQEPEEYEIRGGMFHFVIPGTTRRVRLPLTYASYSLLDPDSGVWFRVPEVCPD